MSDTKTNHNDLVIDKIDELITLLHRDKYDDIIAQLRELRVDLILGTR